LESVWFRRSQDAPLEENASIIDICGSFIPHQGTLDVFDIDSQWHVRHY